MESSYLVISTPSHNLLARRNGPTMGKPTDFVQNIGKANFFSSKIFYSWTDFLPLLIRKLEIEKTKRTFVISVLKVDVRGLSFFILLTWNNFALEA